MSTETRTETNLDKLKEKIAKLLALTTSTNEHEAALAAQRVQELLLKYNLSLADIKTEEEQADETIEKTLISALSRKYHWAGRLLNAICQVNFCKAIWTGSNLYAIGSPANAAVCKELYLYLVRAVENIADREWKAWKKQAKPKATESTRWYNSFVSGCAGRLYNRLLALRQEQESAGTTDGEVTALACRFLYERAEMAIAKFQQDQGIKVRQGSGSQSKTNSDAYWQGAKAGDSISLNKQVKAGGDQKLLS